MVDVGQWHHVINLSGYGYNTSQMKNEQSLDKSTEHLNALAITYRRRLRMLQLQQAQFGINTPVHIEIELQEVEKNIQWIEQELNQLASSNNTSKKPNSRMSLNIWISLYSLVIFLITIAVFLIPFQESSITSEAFEITLQVFILVFLLLSLVITSFRYFTSGGDRKKVTEAKTNTTTIILGFISLFGAMLVGIATNLTSSRLAEFLSPLSTFIGTLLSLIAGLLGIIASIFFYNKSKREEKQKIIEQIRNQKIVSDNNEDQDLISEGRPL